MTDDVIRCPNGHQVTRAEVQVVNGHLVCPRCLETGAAWRPPAPALRWSRQLLAGPLWLVAAGFALGAVAAILGLYDYAQGLHLTTSNARVDAFVAEAAGNAAIAVGAAIAATIVGRE